jgi:serine/threonine-protein kinase
VAGTQSVHSREAPPTETTAQRPSDTARYRILDRLGAGAMGTVYLAEDRLLDRRVALKVHDRFDGDDALAHALEEARAVARVEHPHIVRVHDVMSEGPRLHVVFELLEGEDLRARLGRDGRLSARECVALLTPVADALAHAHARGVTHQDIKPENIFLASREGRVEPVLVDFGVAVRNDADRETDFGTPRYMAPERWPPGAAPDARADLWALGAVLYECLTGRAAFPAEDFDALARAIATTDPAPLRDLAPNVPTELARVVERALARDPGARFQNAAALRDALRASLGRSPVARRAALGAALLVAFGGVLGFSRSGALPRATGPLARAALTTLMAPSPTDPTPPTRIAPAAPSTPATNTPPRPTARPHRARHVNPRLTAPRGAPPHWTDFVFPDASRRSP